MRTYYINEVKLLESSWDCVIIGLFTEENWSGEGSFCGWYSMEYYNNTTLLAIGYQEEKDICQKSYNPKKKFTRTKILKENLDQILIGSGLWSKSFYAENDEKAIDIFLKQEW